VLLLFPTVWDAKQLAGGEGTWRETWHVEFAEPTDGDFAWDLDVLAYLDALARAHRGALDGVTSSSDYPGPIVAAALAGRLGLPGADPRAVLRASHKYCVRRALAEVAPEASPRFALVDPREGGGAGLEFPCFLKPVRGSFSVMSARIESRAELDAFLARPALAEFLRDYVAVFNKLAGAYGPLEVDGSYLLAEGLLSGEQVTVEGWVQDSEIAVLGIVDSIFHPGTRSFARFDYPSAHAPALQARMEELARRAIARLGLDHTLWNVELIHDAERDALAIIEVNPRMCSQFADLYQKVDGTSGYEVALALATGRRPAPRRRAGAFACASSVPLRTFHAVRVARAPDAARVAKVEAEHPGALVLFEYAAGEELRDFERYQDGASARFAVINLGARTRADLDREVRAIQAALDYRLDPL
jgi:hypothetical protein